MTTRVWISLVLLTFQGIAARATRETLSLDGKWRIAFDAGNEGMRDEWFREGMFPQKTEEITVPSCWEQIRKDYEGVAWYRRTFETPASWKGRHVRLGFDAVNYIAEVWLSGHVVGSHEGGFTPFDFDVTALLELDRQNVLLVRAVGLAVRVEQVDMLAKNEAPHWRAAYVGGIWQSVRLVASHPAHIKDIFVEPRINSGRAVVHYQIRNASTKNADLSAVVTISKFAEESIRAAGDRAKLIAVPGVSKFNMEIQIESPALWSPERPNLYVARVELRSGGKVVDAKSVRFGMREFTIRDGDFYFNGEKIFIKGAFWEGVYPATMAHPRDEEIVRREIRMAKEAGFNLLRPWRMPPAPMILDMADEIGMLLIGSPAVACMGYWPAEKPRMGDRWTAEMVDMVRRDRNHPSIICWETANEILRYSMLVRLHGVTLAAREADPTRMIIDESGGSRAPWGAHAYLPYSSEPMEILDRHIYKRSPVDASTYDYLARYGEADTLTFVSEVGYGGAPDLPANVRIYKQRGNPNTPDYRYHHELLASFENLLDTHDLRTLFPDVSSLCLATQQLQAVGNKLQLEALRVNANCDGYCLHAFTGGDWVLGAGVLDMWRRPKLMYGAAKDVQRPLYLAIRPASANIYAEKGTKLTITAVNDGRAVEGRLVVVLTDPEDREIRLASRNVRVEPGVNQLLTQRVVTASLNGMCRITAELSRGSKTLTDNSYELLVMGTSELEPPVNSVLVIDHKNMLRNFFTPRGVTCRNFDGGMPPDGGSVLVASADAWADGQLKHFERLMQWIKRGGTAIWLRPPSLLRYHGQKIYTDYDRNYLARLNNLDRSKWWLGKSRLIESGVFPFELHHRNARGMWIPVVHYTMKHPVFEGLPDVRFMGQPYQNVAADSTFESFPDGATVIAGSVSWNVEHDYHAKMWAWHGVDLATVPYGKGKMILSRLRIVENIGTDPIADRILFNLIKFAGKDKD